MKRERLFFLFFALACVSTSFPQRPADTIYRGKTSIRGLVVDTARREVWFSGSNGVVGRYNETDHTTVERRIVFDSIKPDFRSMAQTGDAIFVLSTGSPALLYRIDKSSVKARLVYRDTAAGVFYDSLQFSDQQNGMAIGDPIVGCFTVLITTDGGARWNELDCKTAPSAADGEASFAASNTGLALRGNDAWFVSGGARSRIFHSADFGKRWQASEVPLQQGSETQGTFSLALAGNDSMAAAGGNYIEPSDNRHNFAFTDDAGKTWREITTPFGYVSCVQPVPGTNDQSWICATAQGIFVTDDKGASWKKVAAGVFHTLRLEGDTFYAAGANALVSGTYK